MIESPPLPPLPRLLGDEALSRLFQLRDLVAGLGSILDTVSKEIQPTPVSYLYLITCHLVTLIKSWLKMYLICI